MRAHIQRTSDLKSVSKNVDYKDAATLKKFLNQNGTILPRKVTGISASEQRKVACAVKRARFLGLLPYVER